MPSTIPGHEWKLSKWPLSWLLALSLLSLPKNKGTSLFLYHDDCDLALTLSLVYCVTLSVQRPLKSVTHCLPWLSWLVLLFLIITLSFMVITSRCGGGGASTSQRRGLFHLHKDAYGLAQALSLEGEALCPQIVSSRISHLFAICHIPFIVRWWHHCQHSQLLEPSLLVSILLTPPCLSLLHLPLSNLLLLICHDLGQHFSNHSDLNPQ